MDWPCVTAIVNTYKRADLLARALESVLCQDFKDFEVIVIHDGPANEDTEEVCEEYAAKFEGRDVVFRFMATDECSGYQCVPKNVATWHSHGDYIAYLDDDNEWTQDHLTVLVNAMEESKVWPDFAYGRRLYVDDRSVKIPALAVGESPFVPFEVGASALSESPLKNFIDTSDVIVAKGAMWALQLATGMMWNEGLRRFGDWELFTRGVFLAGWRGKGVDKIVQIYHWHGDNVQLTRKPQETPKQKVIGRP